MLVWLPYQVIKILITLISIVASWGVLSRAKKFCPTILINFLRVKSIVLVQNHALIHADHTWLTTSFKQWPNSEFCQLSTSTLCTCVMLLLTKAPVLYRMWQCSLDVFTSYTVWPILMQSTLYLSGSALYWKIKWSVDPILVGDFSISLLYLITMV